MLESKGFSGIVKNLTILSFSNHFSLCPHYHTNCCYSHDRQCLLWSILYTKNRKVNLKLLTYHIIPLLKKHQGLFFATEIKFKPLCTKLKAFHASCSFLTASLGELLNPTREIFFTDACFLTYTYLNLRFKVSHMLKFLLSFKQ